MSVLDSPAVRRELADRLTEQLARSGNQNAIAFRPAVVLAVETVVDTDTFRSIFRTAIRRTHEALLLGGSGSSGLDLSDSFAIVAASLAGAEQRQGELERRAGPEPGRRDEEARRPAHLGPRRHHQHGRDRRRSSARPRSPPWPSRSAAIAGTGWPRRLGAGRRRRRASSPCSSWAASTPGGGSRTTRCHRPSRGAGASDRRTSTPWRFWMMAYGIVVAAAAGALGSRGPPPHAGGGAGALRGHGWSAGGRRPGGPSRLGVLGLAASACCFIQDPRGNLELLTSSPGCGSRYLAVLELVSPDPPRGRGRGGRRRRGGRRASARSPPAHRGWGRGRAPRA